MNTVSKRISFLILIVLLLAGLVWRQNLAVAMAVNEGRICLSKQLAHHLPLQQCKDKFIRTSHDFPGNARIHESLGFIYFQQGRFQQAVDEFRTSASDNLIKGLYLGLALDEIGSRDRAVYVWQSVGASQYFLLRGKSLMQKGLLNPAVEQFERAILIEPDFEVARIALGDVYIGLGEYSKVETILNNWTTQFLNVHGYCLVGLARYRQRNDRGAEEAYLQALKLDPVNYEATWWLGHVYWRQERWKDALEIFRPISGSAKGRWAVGAILNRLGDRAAALRSHLEGIEYDPEYTANYFASAYLYEQEGQIEASVKMYQEVLRRDPNNQSAKEKMHLLSDLN